MTRPRRELGVLLPLLAATVGCDKQYVAAVPRVDASVRVPDARVPDARVPDAGSPVPDDVVRETPWKSLIDERFSQLYRYLPSHGRDKDPDGVFKVEGDVLHVLGNAPPAEGREQEFGYVSTREELGNYQLRLVQRWGTTKFAPRAGDVRDSGLLYHTRGDDKIWPTSIELQIQEHDIGDLFLVGGTGSTTRVSPDNMNVFQENGVERMLRDQNTEHGPTMELLTGWNELEVIASGRDWVHLVNGALANRGAAAEYRDGESWLPLDRGRILLQAEGAEVFYRDLQIRPLSYTPAPDGALVLGIDAFQHVDGRAPEWKSLDDGFEVVLGKGDLLTREKFGSVRLHVEFRVPLTVREDAGEQDRGNSGVYLQDRYEVQVLDSFGRKLEDTNDCAAIYSVKDASSNAAFPSELWQSYDIVYRAPSEQKAARITVIWNGTKVHDDVELPAENAPQAEASIRLQDHSQPVRYRNIWLKRL